MRVRTAVGPVVVAAVAGVLVGIVAAYGYFHARLNPLAHTLGVWALLASVVAYGRRTQTAVACSTATLAAGVVLSVPDMLEQLRV